MLDGIRGHPRLVISGALAIAAIAALLGLFVEPTPGLVNRLAAWLTIAAAVIGVAAFVVAVVAVPPVDLSEQDVRAITAAEESEGQASGEEDDEEPKYEPPAAGRVRGLARPVRGLPDFYEWSRDAVPIYVLADIVQWWRDEQIAGRMSPPRPGKRWLVSEVEHAIRKKVGRGSPAWYIKFAQDEAYYRVASGGYGRLESDPQRKPAVKRVALGDVS